MEAFSQGAGSRITLTVKALKNDWMEGLVELTTEELEGIGEYTVIIGGKEEKPRMAGLLSKLQKPGHSP